MISPLSHFLYFFLGFLFSFLYLVETIGYAIRESGKVFGVPALGYSLHTQFGTTARMSTMVALPAIGYLLDEGVPVELMVIIPATAVGIFSLVMLLAYLRIDKLLMLVEVFFQWYILKLYGVTVFRRDNEETNIDVVSAQRGSIALAAFSSFFIVVFGVFSVILLASIFHERRALIMQSSVVFTAFGTFISIFYFDPKISTVIDSSGDFRALIRDIFLSRLVAMLLAGAILPFFIYIEG